MIFEKDNKVIDLNSVIAIEKYDEDFNMSFVFYYLRFNLTYGWIQVSYEKDELDDREKDYIAVKEILKQRKLL